jgi:hypothetical protein
MKLAVAVELDTDEQKRCGWREGCENVGSFLVYQLADNGFLFRSCILHLPAMLNAYTLFAAAHANLLPKLPV